MVLNIWSVAIWWHWTLRDFKGLTIYLGCSSSSSDIFTNRSVSSLRYDCNQQHTERYRLNISLHACYVFTATRSRCFCGSLNTQRFSCRYQLLLVDHRLWWRHLFFKCCYFRIDSVDTLNGSLRNFNRWRASVENRNYEEMFWVLVLKKWGPKTTYFRRLCNSMANLRANISSREQAIDSWETALETTKCPLYRRKISWSLAHKRLPIGP